MKYLVLLLPLVAAGCADSYDRGYAAGYDSGYPSARGYDSGYPSYASGYGYNDGYYGRRDRYYGRENCGTPYEPKACPPMPRVPLQYYPGYR